MQRAMVAALALGIGLIAARAARTEARADAGWTPLGRGVEHRVLDGEGLAGHAFRFHPADVDLRVVAAAPGQRARVAALAPPAGDAIAINASFFDEAGHAMGLAIDRGRSVGGRRIAAWAGFVIQRGQPRIAAATALGDGDGAELLVQGFPRLVVGGSVPRLKPQRAQRTVVCVAGERVVLLVATTRVDATELARFLAAPADAGGLGCRDALNLDGGGSTQLAARWGDLEARFDGAWAVPNALVVTPRASTAGAAPR